MSDQVKTIVSQTTQYTNSFQPFRSGSEVQSRPQRTVTSPTDITEVDFAESEDGSLLEMIEDPDDRSKSVFAISKNGGFELADRVSSGGRVLVPIPRDRNIIRHVRLPRGIENYDSTRVLLRRIMSIFSRCLDLPDIYRLLLSCFVLSTWVIDQLFVAPYIALIGLPRSGKSTALELLNLLCRRGLLTADISSAAFYWVCDCLTPTLLIDETSTSGDRRTLFHLLRTGTTREPTAIRKNESFKTFGAKGISWTELPNDPALNSRCIVIPMEETRRTNLIRPSSPEIVQAADQLQRQLLQFRFEKYKQLQLPKIEGAAKLHSRARDLYEALALACGEDTETCNFLAGTFKVQQDSNREPLLPTQSGVLQFLYYAIHNMPQDGNAYPLNDLTNGVNSLLQVAGEGFRMKPRAVGAALSSLGFTRRKRTNMGFQMILDRAVQKRVHHLIDLYGIDNNAAMPSKECRESCEFCRELALTEQCG